MSIDRKIIFVELVNYHNYSDTYNVTCNDDGTCHNEGDDDDFIKIGDPVDKVDFSKLGTRLDYDEIEWLIVVNNHIQSLFVCMSYISDCPNQERICSRSIP